MPEPGNPANTLTKLANGTAAWNTGATSTQKIASGDGSVQVTADVTNTLKMFGLADNETSSGYDDIDYAFYLYSNGSLYVYQSGVNKGMVGSYLPGDTLTVAVEGGVVKYYRNATLLYTSTVTPVYPLFMDSTIFTPGAQLQEAIIGKGQQPVYYHADQLGSTRATTGAFGQVVNAYTYDAYGNTTSSTGTAFVYNPFEYSGEYMDVESGLLYLRARYYDPASQQFLSVDPLLATTEQAYAYVGGSPINAIDPAGLAWSTGDDGHGGVGLFPEEDDEASALWEAAAMAAPGIAGTMTGINGGGPGAKVIDQVVGELKQQRDAKNTSKPGDGSGNVEACPAGGTYVLKDPETGDIMRSGRTGDLTRRAVDHQRDPLLKNLEYNVDSRTDKYAQQRGREQYLHDKYNPPLNKIRPISPRNKRIQEYMNAGKEVGGKY